MTAKPSPTSSVAMLCPDVNVLLYALRRDSGDHSRYAEWLQLAMTGHEPVGVSEFVLSGVVRLATNHRVYRQPSRTADVLDFCGHRQRCARRYEAALAIEHGATWITNDRRYTQFPNLLWRSPID